MISLDGLAALAGKRALITGGSKGLGAAIAITFAKAGIDVGIIGRNHKDLSAVQEAVNVYGRSCWIIKADLENVEECQAAGEQALKFSKQWDILVHSAGIAYSTPLLEIDQEQWDKMHHVNLRSIVFLSQKIVPSMIKQGGGKIILISSLAAFVGTPGFAAYSTSKGGLNQLTRTMASEWGPKNIRVNAICPTIILTDMGQAIWNDPSRLKQKEEALKRIPLHRFGEPQDVADLALFLASPGSDFINGQCIPLDGGKSIAP